MRRLILPIVSLLLAGGAAPALAANLEVKVMQNNAAPSQCTLRRAIQNANANNQGNIGCNGGSGADVITFDVDTDGGTLTLDEPLPAITGPLTIRGRGAKRTRVSGGGLHRPLTVDAGVTLVLESITIDAGDAGAGNGGALLLQPGAQLVLRDARITGSEAVHGGGIYADQATVRIERSLIDGNTAADQGGGLLSRGSAVEIVNATLSGNSADEGGGLAVVDAAGPGTTRLRSVTLANNGASAGGNAFVAGGSELEARHALFALAFAGGSCDGPITSLDWNLADDASCDLAGTNDLDGVAAGLATLADNGGPTATHRLQAGSAAIDAGDVRCRDPQGVELETDQRGPGFPRRTDGDGLPGFECDIGAFEAVPEPGAAGSAAAALALAALARRRRLRVP